MNGAVLFFRTIYTFGFSRWSSCFKLPSVMAHVQLPLDLSPLSPSVLSPDEDNVSLESAPHINIGAATPLKKKLIRATNQKLGT